MRDDDATKVSYFASVSTATTMLPPEALAALRDANRDFPNWYRKGVVEAILKESVSYSTVARNQWYTDIKTDPKCEFASLTYPVTTTTISTTTTTTMIIHHHHHHD